MTTAEWIPILVMAAWCHCEQATCLAGPGPYYSCTHCGRQIEQEWNSDWRPEGSVRIRERSSSSIH